MVEASFSRFHFLSGARCVKENDGQSIILAGDMMLDYLLFRQLVAELRDRIVGSRIRKVVQSAPLELALSFGKGSGLVISLKPRLAHLRVDALPESGITTPFLLLMKKYLEGRRIVSFGEVRGQKIVVAGFGETTLVVEMPGIRNAAFLLSAEKRILGSYPHVETTLEDKRILQNGFPYEEPEPPGFHLFLAPEETLTREWPEIYAGGDRRWWGLNKLHWGVLREHEAPEALALFLGARKRLDLRPIVVFKDEEPEGISVLPAARDFKPLASASLSSAIGHFFSEESKKSASADERKRALAVVTQLLSKKQKKLEALSSEYEAAGHGEEFKESGDILLTYSKGIGRGSVEFVDPSSGKIIPLDPKLNGVENAQAYYKRFKKAKHALVAIRHEIDKLGKEIQDLSELETWALLAEDEAHWSWLSGQLDRFRPKTVEKRKRGRASGDRFLRVNSSEGFTLLVGRNAAENVEVLHEAAKEDWWFHAKEIPGGHVVIRVEQRPVTDAAIAEAASLAAYYSKGREWDKVPVHYALRKDVRPIPGGKAHVTYRNFKTVLVSPKPL